MNELRIDKIEKENKGKPIGTVFPNFFDNLPDNVKYLDNLDYLKKVKLDVSPNQITMYSNSNEKIGDVKFLIDDQPFRHMYVENTTIETKFSGKKYGSMLVEILNAFLRKKGIVGLLYNAPTIPLRDDEYDITDNNKNINKNICIGDVCMIKEEVESDPDFNLSNFWYNRHGWEPVVDIGGLPVYMFYNGMNQDIEKIVQKYETLKL